MSKIMILGIVVISLLVFLPIVLFLLTYLGEYLDKLDIKNSKVGDHFMVRGYDKFGTSMICIEMQLKEIDGDTVYFDYLDDYQGRTMANAYMPHHISNYHKSFWKI